MQRRRRDSGSGRWVKLIPNTWDFWDRTRWCHSVGYRYVTRLPTLQKWGDLGWVKIHQWSPGPVGNFAFISRLAKIWLWLLKKNKITIYTVLSHVCQMLRHWLQTWDFYPKNEKNYVDLNWDLLSWVLVTPSFFWGGGWIGYMFAKDVCKRFGLES